MTDEITLDAPETPLERFLAAAAGMDGITLDEPVTRIEKYLYKIAQGSGGVPAVEDADKGKYLHANESTGDLEWATAGGSGGGVLVASMNLETMTLNKTWQEIHDAVLNGGAVLQIEAMGIAAQLSAANNKGTYIVSIVTDKVLKLSTDSANGYPVMQQ